MSYTASSIKLDHDHAENGRPCFLIRQGTRKLTETVSIHFLSQHHTAGFMPYTGHWYLFNKDGEQVGSVTQEFFEDVLRRWCAPLQDDPNCVRQ